MEINKLTIVRRTVELKEPKFIWILPRIKCRNRRCGRVYNPHKVRHIMCPYCWYSLNPIFVIPNPSKDIEP